MTEISATSRKLPEYKVKFINALIDSGALKLGADYALKSKREAPYFLNIGGFNSGQTTSILANAYADAIAATLKDEFDYIYGIPEKGVGLAPTTSMALDTQHAIDSNWFFDRKGGAKEYGEATNLSIEERLAKIFMGGVPKEGKRILIVDDVLTTGKTKFDAIENLTKFLPDRKIIGIMIALDRQEVDIHGKSAMEEFTEKTGVPVYSILQTTDIVQYMEEYPEHKDNQRRVSTYLRVYGTQEARVFVTPAIQAVPIMRSQKSIIPACDTRDIHVFEELVKQTSDLEGIGGYKLGFMLSLTYGLPKVVEIARKYTDKPLIYDHQKAATDIPDTAKDFMIINKEAGINAVILFPHTGPETERAWIYRAMDNGLGIIVGGIMTHPGYLVSEGGFIVDEGALSIYRIAAKAGVTNFVVPGTKPDLIKTARDIIEEQGIFPTFHAPGFGSSQGGNVDEVKKILGKAWNPIVGRQILKAENGNFRRAAEELIEQLLR